MTPANDNKPHPVQEAQAKVEDALTRIILMSVSRTLSQEQDK